MANNDISGWMDEQVSIIDAHYCGKSVRFGDLLPYLQAKPDAFELTDHYKYATTGEFIASYSCNHSNLGYGDFMPDI